MKRRWRDIVCTRYPTACRLALGLLAACLVSWPAARAQERAQDWTITDIGTLGGASTIARDINERGQIVGQSARLGDSDARHAFLYENGTMRDLALTGGYNVARGINNAGVVVAYDIIDSDEFFPLLYRDGVVKKLDVQGYGFGINDAGDVVGTIGPVESGIAALFRRGEAVSLGTLGGTYSIAFGINNADQVVGIAGTAGDAAYHAFLYQGAQMRDLGTLGGSYSQAFAINRRGWVVGASNLSGDTVGHAFLYDGRQMRDLGSLGDNSLAWGINDRGDIVGRTDIEGESHAFLYRCGAMLDLNTLPVVKEAGWLLIEAVAINNLGQIAANGVVQGESRGFLLSPPRHWQACPQTDDADAGLNQSP